jgi:hypothetical protein
MLIQLEVNNDAEPFKKVLKTLQTEGEGEREREAEGEALRRGDGDSPRLLILWWL